MSNNSKWKLKAKDSFNTKLNLFVYSWLINNNNTLDYIDYNALSSFQITNDLVNQYASDWQIDYQSEDGQRIKKMDMAIIKWRDEFKKAKDIKFLQLQKEYIENYKNIFSKNDFIELESKDKCEYCDITIKDIELLVEKKKLFKKQITRGFGLEIDRINSNFEYTKENSVRCCYWCNNAKTDEFTYEEFKRIGNVIKQIWKERLKN